ncbi:hypothetical protein AWC38_SpisGene14331 [Stylophora pistillata]|uniref:Transposase Helix-turn-helix domain-containing protein n=1 Tax=Stylophora pistillata TaxID=50429 RepID=A0A2B4RVL1_STYPI|nr:hypothetical protein AWC38_SpisGene14331 [Stylophora pistillata]
METSEAPKGSMKHADGVMDVAREILSELPEKNIFMPQRPTERKPIAKKPASEKPVEAAIVVEPVSNECEGDTSSLTCEHKPEKSEEKLLRGRIKELESSFESEILRRKFAESPLEAKIFSVKNLSQDEKVFKFYTDFSEEQFDCLLEFLGDGMNNLTYWGSSGATSCNNAELWGLKPGPSRRLAPEYELLLVLTKLRVGMLEQDLSLRSQLSQSHVSRIITNNNDKEGGSISDRDFTLKCGLLNKDWSKGKGQFEEEDLVETRRIAKYSIHVERAIKRIKNYHILDYVPTTLCNSDDPESDQDEDIIATEEEIAQENVRSVVFNLEKSNDLAQDLNSTLAYLVVSGMLIGNQNYDRVTKGVPQYYSVREGVASLNFLGSVTIGDELPVSIMEKEVPIPSQPHHLDLALTCRKTMKSVYFYTGRKYCFFHHNATKPDLT